MRSAGARVRVLVVIDHVGGGTGQHLLGLLEAFDPTRVTVAVVTEGAVEFGCPAASRVRRMPRLRRLHRFPFAQAHNLRVLIDEVRRSPVDIVHAYGLWPILYGRLLRRLGLIDHLVENRESDTRFWPWPTRLAMRLGKRMPDRVVCVSQSIAAGVLFGERHATGTVVVIENGVAPTPGRSTRNETRRTLGVPSDAFVVGAVAAHMDRPAKGLRYLVDAMPRILARVPQAWFVLVGGHAADGALVAEIRQRSVAHRVVLAGYRERVADLYPAMDVLALPSLTEGLPLTLLEAMRSSLPVVAFRVGGIPEVLVDGVTGRLVVPGDPAALAEQLVALWGEPELRRSMGRAGRKRVEQLFDVGLTARRYEGLYESVDGESHGAAGATRCSSAGD